MCRQGTILKGILETSDKLRVPVIIFEENEDFKYEFT